MEGLGNRAGVAAVLSQIGQVEERRSKHERALERYEASLKIMKELGNRMGEANLLHSIGYIHQMRGDNESALRHYDTSLKISEELGNRAGVAHAHAQIGQLFMQFGSYPQAFSLLLLALTTFTELQSTIESTVIDMLKELRTRWGPTNFDVAWREAKNQEPPERLKR
jgi:tetratricopeptide (TPR) repeat protein